MISKELLEKEYIENKKTQQEIAKIFSISQTQVGRIIRGVRWKHLTSSNAV